MIDPNKTYTVVGVVVEKHRIILFMDDGTKQLLNTSSNLTPLLRDEVIPSVSRIGKWTGRLVIHEKEENIYSEYEAISSVVKFFRVAKDKICSLVGITKEEDKVPLGTHGKAEDFHVSDISTILDGAQDTKSPSFKASDFDDIPEFTGDNSLDSLNKSEDTLIAVVDGDKVIPDVQALNNYIKSSAYQGNSQGLDNFLKRISAIVENRKHTVEDLLVFLQRAELPLANDGRIIAYKRVNTLDPDNGIYTDVHSGRVKQKVGQRVQTDIQFVDSDRNRDCSYGLHIARRAYLNRFSGDTILLLYVAPEDFIAVPEETGNKARVTGYDIIAALTNEQKAAVLANIPITQVEGGKALLEKAVNNKFPESHEIVMLNDRSGYSITINKIGEDSVTTEEVIDTLPSVEDLKNEITSSPSVPTLEEVVSKPVTKLDFKEVVKVTDTHPPKLSYKQEVKSIVEGKSTLTNEEIERIKTIRKQSKKGLKVLGVPESLIPLFK